MPPRRPPAGADGADRRRQEHRWRRGSSSGWWRPADRSPASDHDDVARLGHAPGGLTEDHWAQAHVTHGALVGALLEQPFDLVVAHGPVYSAEETGALLAHVPPGTGVLRVLLTCEVRTALDRVVDDPERGLSRDPAFLARTHARFWDLRPGIAADLVADTGTTSVEEVCRLVEARLRPA
jgi:hypothetical protein